MHGLINRAIQCFYRDTYGAPAWGEVVRRLELDFTEFEPMLHYGNELTQRMIGEMAAALGKDRETVLEDVGTYLISNPAVEAPRRLLRFGGETFLDFLHSLDDLPDRARLAVEDLVLPALELRDYGGNQFSLFCTGDFAGIGHVAVGVLRAMADDYGALVFLEHKGVSHGAEVIEITLIEAAFAEGRAFELGLARAGGRVMDDLAHLLDVLCPMHLVLDRTGHIAHVGPTLAKLRPAEVLAGQRFLEVFEMRRPRSVRDAGDLRHHAGARLHMRFRSGAPIGLKGVLMPAPGKSGGLVVNLSFGISVVEAVREFSLTGGDFAATDLTIEMLYLVEAKSAAMEASRKLNQKLEGAKIAAEEQAFTDTLTGLKNRRAMDHVLARLVAGPGRFALMHLDLDYFKAVNDSMGHAAGDHVLQEVAKILVEETRREDTVARVGGDEFMLLFVGKMNRRRLTDISERLIARLERPIAFGAEVCRISGSIGITMSEDYEALDMAQLQEDADIALYASKNRGRACHTFYDPALRTGAFAISPEAPGSNVTLG